MKKIVKIISIAAVFTIVLRAQSLTVHADGLTVSTDKDSCEIGDKITVTVDTGATGDSIPPDVSVEFNANRLNFENCSVEYGGGGGGLVTFKDTKADIEFTTLSGGSAEVKVTATVEDAAEPETSSVTVSVNGEDTAGDSDTDAQTTTGVASDSIDIGDGRVIQTVFADEFKPVLFHKDTTEYQGQTVECAKFDMGDITLLYTTDQSGADGRFMMIDPGSGELGDFRMIQGIENRFIIVLSDCEGEIPAGYTKAVLEWNGQTLTAFMDENVAAGNAQAINGIDPGDFFLVYAMSSEGNKGWYRYDKNEGTYQRFFDYTSTDAEGVDNDDSFSDNETMGLIDEYIPRNVQTILLLVCAPLALILLISVIILGVQLRDYSDELDAIYADEDYYEDEEEDDDEEEEETYVRKRAGSGAVTAASLVGRSMSEDEDEEDEDDEEADEEDEDEEEDEEETYRRPLSRREQRELAREEKWRLKEEKKAAKRRAKGYEEATPMDWSSFEKSGGDDEDVKVYNSSKPPRYMTEPIEQLPEEEDEAETEVAPKKEPLPPRKKVVRSEDSEEAPKVLKEEEQREKQRRLFEQQQRIEEQRRIEAEQLEEQRLKEQQQYIASKVEDDDLDEDFQFEFLNL